MRGTIVVHTQYALLNGRCTCRTMRTSWRVDISSGLANEISLRTQRSTTAQRARAMPLIKSAKLTPPHRPRAADGDPRIKRLSDDRPSKHQVSMPEACFSLQMHLDVQAERGDYFALRHDVWRWRRCQEKKSCTTSNSAASKISRTLVLHNVLGL